METIETWPRCPEAAELFAGLFSTFAAANPVVAELRDRFKSHAGVDIASLVDHWVLPHAAKRAEEVAACGLVETVTEDGDAVWAHPLARLPRIRLDPDASTPRLAIIVEDIRQFLEANALSAPGQLGDPDSGYEEIRLPLADGTLAAIVRTGYAGFRPGELPASSARALAGVRARLRSRNREADDDMALRDATALIRSAVEELGQDRAADEFFAAERDYYMSRNAVARWQYQRQQEVGIGWSNHDHHTYRSSRTQFRELMQFFQLFGFVFRERYYAGADAGWGAQILEHPVSRVVIFSDVDLAPSELDIDFASEQLAPRATYGTIGLWCALHGTSIGRAGMHHLECEFDFSQAETNMRSAGFGVMKPFTDMPALKQEFTAAEIWSVEQARLRALVESRAISADDADRFARSGAPGSHLEILQRWEGFKGFNKTGVSRIISATDARNTGGAGTANA